MLAKYQGRTTALASRSPIWAPEEIGSEFIGEYVGTQEIQQKGEKPFTACNFKLMEYRGTGFTVSKQPWTPVIGATVSCSGMILTEALKDVKKGAAILVRYNGLGEKKGKRSPAKLFEVHQLELAA